MEFIDKIRSVELKPTLQLGHHPPQSNWGVFVRTTVGGCVSELDLSGQAQGCCDPRAGAGIWAPAIGSRSHFSPFTRESDLRVPTQNLLTHQASLLYVSVIPGFSL